MEMKLFGIYSANSELSLHIVFLPANNGVCHKSNEPTWENIPYGICAIEGLDMSVFAGCSMEPIDPKVP